MWEATACWHAIVRFSALYYLTKSLQEINTMKTIFSARQVRKSSLEKTAISLHDYSPTDFQTFLKSRHRLLYSAFLLGLLVCTNSKPMKRANKSPLHRLAACTPKHLWTIQPKGKKDPTHFSLLFKWSGYYWHKRLQKCFFMIFSGLSIFLCWKSRRWAISNLKQK